MSSVCGVKEEGGSEVGERKIFNGHFRRRRRETAPLSLFPLSSFPLTALLAAHLFTGSGLSAGIGRPVMSG